jgi:hypothetical protein
VYAHIHWRLASDLEMSLEQHPLVEAQSKTFWYLTHRAHSAIALQLLCRAFDQEQSSLHLLSWLKDIQSNLSLFDAEAFREQLKDNTYVASLAAEAEKPDPHLLAKDVAQCMASDPLVRKLVAYRGSQAAHRSTKLALCPTLACASTALTDDDVTELLTRADTILNRYSYMFAAETHSTAIIGRTDYKYIFESVEAAVQRARVRDGD